MSRLTDNDVGSFQEGRLAISTIVEASPNAVIALNEQQKVIAFNTKAEELFGYTHDEMHEAQDLIKIIPPKYRDKYRQAIEHYFQMLDQGHIPLQKRVLVLEGMKKNGDIFPIRLSFGEKRDETHTIVVVTIQDITEEKRNEEIIKRYQELSHTGKILSMIAHQWRQPLSALLMSAYVMKTKFEKGNPDKAELSQLLDHIVQCAKFLEQTIEDFRYFFMPEHKHPEHTDCDSIVQRALQIVTDEFEEEGILLRYTPTDTPLFATYAKEVMQALLVILKNARDVLIERRTEPAIITIRITEENHYHRIEVCDNAGGIKTEPITKVFDLFYTTKTNGKGTGLGLYIAKIIVEEHCRGILTVRNTKEGACFCIQLPDLDDKTD